MVKKIASFISSDKENTVFTVYIYIYIRGGHRLIFLI